MHRFKQPVLGIVSAVAVMIVSLAFIALFDYQAFSGWVAYAFICTTPTAIIIGTIWSPFHPAFPGLTQPSRGLALVALAATLGAVGTAVGFLTVGGSVSPPLPALSQFAVLSIPVTFWLCIIWSGWPFVLLPNRIAATAGLLVSYYVVTYALFRLFVSSGAVTGMTANAYAVTGVAVMFLILQFQLWPLTRARQMSGQANRGAIWSVLVLATSAGLILINSQILGMASPVYMASVPIPFIFGSILSLNTLQGSAVARLRQPIKGLCGSLIAVALGGLLALLYHALSPTVTGPLSSGPPTYETATWLASALLGVTFLFLSIYKDFFDFWPIAAPKTSVPRPPGDPAVRRR